MVDSPSARQLQDLALAAGQLAAAAPWRDRRVDEALLGERRPRPRGAAPRRRRCGRRRRSRRPASRRWRGGARAARRGRRCRARARPCAARGSPRRRSEPGPTPSDPSAHVDDRDVEVADVADQLQRLLAARSLVDLEAVLEHSAHSEPDERVTVDHKTVGRALRTAPILAARLAPETPSGQRVRGVR